MEEQIGGKLSDIENNNLQLNDLTQQLNDLVSECEVIYNDYEAKKEKVSLFDPRFFTFKRP